MSTTITAPEPETSAADRDFIISRHFNVSREHLFAVWTECAHLRRWFGPKGMEIVHCTNDLRTGGVMHYGLRTPDGGVMWGRWVHREISAPEQLVFVSSFSDEAGGITRHPMCVGWPLEMLSTVTFDRLGHGARVTVRAAAHNATELERETFRNAQPGMREGWSGTFSQLSDYLALA
jgi:uncharacterized protein YndB with AHSA1/START domain